MERRKMVKTANVIDRVLKALQKILIVGGCLLLFAGLCMFVFRDIILAHTEFITDSISFGVLSLTIPHAEALVDPKLLADSQMVTGVLFAVFILLAWYGIRLFRRILEPMKAGEPFCAGVSENLKKLAFFVIVAGVAEQVFTAIASHMMIRAYDLSKLINMQAVEKYTLDYTFDFGFAAVAAVLFLLAYVFYYGEELQKESDETL